MTEDVRKLPVWVYYMAFFAVVAVTYSVYLHVRIDTLDADIRQKGSSNSSLENRINNLKNGFEAERDRYEKKIHELEQKISRAEQNYRKELDRANMEAIEKLERERDRHKEEMEAEAQRIIEYYQKKCKTAATPPPPKKKK
ncbi:MAG: hypothetical protein U5N86_09720 [Planctomycetota bacterium]|nr:hypothetical protein [Planctomycetota bacterium]